MEGCSRYGDADLPLVAAPIAKKSCGIRSRLIKVSFRHEQIDVELGQFMASRVLACGVISSRIGARNEWQ